MFKRFSSILLTCAAVLSASLLFAQDATIKGKITDNEGEALVGANVFIQSTNLGAATDENGNYHFTVPASRVHGQEVKLTARFIGYRHKTEKVTLTAGTITLDFVLAEDVLQMDAIVVTGVIDETPKTKLAFSVATIDAEALEHAPAGSPESSLRGKVAGVKVIQASGQPGSSASVQLRAPTSINASGRSQDPLYIVDGVIIDPSISGSPLADIPSEDIESMEIVKGAAGASLYGSRAANGVVVIKTKRGSRLGVGQTKISVRNEIGFDDLERKLSLSRHHHYKVATSSYTDANGDPVTPGDFIDGDGNLVDPRAGGARVPEPYLDPDEFPQAKAIFFQDNEYKYVATGNVGDPLEPLTSPFDHLNLFFDPGEYFNNTVAISRNMESTNFLVSFGNRTETGVIDGIDGFNRKSARINIDHKFRTNLNLGVSALFSQSTRDLGGNSASDDGFSTGGRNPFFALTFMAADADLAKKDANGDLFVQPDPEANEENPLISIRNHDRQDDRKRVMGSATLRWTPSNWFNVEGAFSYDRSDRVGGFFEPVGLKTLDEISPGRMTKGLASDEALNGSVTAQFSRAFGDLTTRFKGRALFERTSVDWFNGEGEIFAVRGIRNMGSTQVQDAGSGTEDIRSQGYSFIGALDYKDRYIVDFLVRRDGSSLFGEEQRWHTYYRGSGAYRLSQESWWFLPFMDEFKIRASYGTAGGRPRFSARFETWSISSGQVVKGNLGNKELKPEFSKELEIGFDASLFNRISLEFSYASIRTEDELLFAPQPGYVGFRNRWINGGVLDSDVLEASLHASIAQSRDFNWTAGINFDRSRSTIQKLTVPSYTVSLGRPAFFIKEGEAFGAMYGDLWMTEQGQLAPGLPADQFQVNDEGYLVWVGEGHTVRDGIADKLWGTSADLTDANGKTRSYRWGIPIKFQDETGSEFHKIGDTTPDFNLSFSNTLRWKGLTVYGLIDAQIGGNVYNNTIQWGNRDLKFGETDQFGKADELKKPSLYYNILYDVNAVNSHYIESGQYMKLREFSLRYSFNRKQLSSFLGGFLQRFTIGVIGRNLFTWTDGFRGYDPEVGIAGGSIGSAVVGRVDAFGYPNFRSFSGLVEFDF